MEKRFVIVYEEGIGYNKETKFKFETTENNVLQEISNMHLNGHDKEVQRIFSVDEFGNVDHYEMALEKFKPTLRMLPRVKVANI